MHRSTVPLLLSALLLLATNCQGQQGDREAEVLLETTAGDIRIKLYNDTPLHRDRFLQNVREGLYDGVLFHRIIRSFMIQTGDPNTRPGHEAELAAAAADTTNALGDTISQEIRFPKYIHKRGVVAAAREGDDINPTMASDAFQFYIVTGKYMDEESMTTYDKLRVENAVNQLYEEKMKPHGEELEAMRRARDRDGISDLLEGLLDEARLEVDNDPPPFYTSDQRRQYRTYGGAPWLDSYYTIFGEVVEGIKVVQTIEKIKTNANDEPLKEVRIRKATIVRE